MKDKQPEHYGNTRQARHRGSNQEIQIERNQTKTTRNKNTKNKVLYQVGMLTLYEQRAVVVCTPEGDVADKEIPLN